VRRPENKEFDDLLKYLPWMTECARRMVSDDYANDIVHLALIDAHAPTKPRPPAEDEKRVKAWLWTLLKFRAIGVWRAKLKQSFEMPVEDEANALAIAESPSWETTIENRQWLQLALNELTKEQRKLVIQCDIEDKRFAPLSGVSGISEKSLRTRLRRAHEQLQSTLVRLSRRRLRAIFPFVFLRCFAPKDAECQESWLQRIQRHFHDVVRHPLQLGTSAFAAACVLGLAPGSPCAKDEPMQAAIAPEPVRVGEVVVTAMPDTVFPGTESMVSTDSSAPITTTTPKLVTRRKNVTQQGDASDVDDRLIVQAKAALNRRDAKRALELLAEHERRFPNSKNAEIREQLRRAGAKMSKADPDN